MFLNFRNQVRGTNINKIARRKWNQERNINSESAGVAIGMALVASKRFPEYHQILLSVAIGTTAFFEIVGPILTRQALNRVYAA
ncbi:hypothetical protein [Kaarinaea lacus]